MDLHFIQRRNIFSDSTHPEYDLETANSYDQAFVVMTELLNRAKTLPCQHSFAPEFTTSRVFLIVHNTMKRMSYDVLLEGNVYTLQGLAMYEGLYPVTRYY